MTDVLLALGALGVFSLGTLFGAWITESGQKRLARDAEAGPLL